MRPFLFAVLGWWCLLLNQASAAQIVYDVRATATWAAPGSGVNIGDLLTGTVTFDFVKTCVMDTLCNTNGTTFLDVNFHVSGIDFVMPGDIGGGYSSHVLSGGPVLGQSQEAMLYFSTGATIFSDRAEMWLPDGPWAYKHIDLGFAQFVSCFSFGGPIGCAPDISGSFGMVSYSRAVAPVPAPAALPLLASGLGALGFIGWRRKQKDST